MNNILENKFVLTPVAQMPQQAIIKVIGVGGGGSNTVDQMVTEQIDGVEFFVANTDQQALNRSKAFSKLEFGADLTRGLGAGADPEIGKRAALEDKEMFIRSLEDADMVFITAGMGGGTGTGAAPVISNAIKEANQEVLIVAVVTTPFLFEGKRRMDSARMGLEELTPQVDSLITIPNEKLLAECDKNISIKEAYAKVNNVLLNAVQGIAELVLKPGHINVDFADVRTVMSKAGSAMMGTGSASGEDRAVKATQAAIANPLLSDVNVSNARGLLINITASSDMSLMEISEIGNRIEQVVSSDATVIVGQVFDDTLGDELRVTLVATGLDDYGRHREAAHDPNGEFSQQSEIFGNSEVPAILRRRDSSPLPDWMIE